MYSSLWKFYHVCALSFCRVSFAISNISIYWNPLSAIFLSRLSPTPPPQNVCVRCPKGTAKATVGNKPCTPCPLRAIVNDLQTACYVRPCCYRCFALLTWRMLYEQTGWKIDVLLLELAESTHDWFGRFRFSVSKWSLEFGIQFSSLTYFTVINVSCPLFLLYSARMALI